MGGGVGVGSGSEGAVASSPHQQECIWHRWVPLFVASVHFYTRETLSCEMSAPKNHSSLWRELHHVHPLAGSLTPQASQDTRLFIVHILRCMAPTQSCSVLLGCSVIAQNVWGKSLLVNICIFLPLISQMWCKISPGNHCLQQICVKSGTIRHVKASISSLMTNKKDFERPVSRMCDITHLQLILDERSATTDVKRKPKKL